jgi:hypothetical protein
VEFWRNTSASALWSDGVINMGIKVEFNPDLALRNIAEFKNGNRKFEECIPENLEVGNVYHFLKKDQRLYFMYGEVTLLETSGNQNLSQPKANVIMLEVTHFVDNEVVFTKGRYKVVKVFQNDVVKNEENSKIEVF